MRCQTIVCKYFAGTHLIRIVWEIVGSLIFVHSEGEFSKRMKDEDHLDPVGFPSEDVYEFSEDALRADNPWKVLNPIVLNK